MIDHTHTVIERSGMTGTQVGGLMAVAGGFTLNTWLGIGGFLIAILSFFLTWYYKAKHYELAKLRLEAELKEMDEDNG